MRTVCLKDQLAGLSIGSVVGLLVNKVKQIYLQDNVINCRNAYSINVKDIVEVSR